MFVRARKPLHLLAFLAPAALASASGARLTRPEAGQAAHGAMLAEPADLPEDVPESLRVRPDERVKLSLSSVGTQNYECRLSGDSLTDPPTAAASGGAVGYGWILLAPEAKLHNASGHLSGRHFQGPTWQYQDGSTVVGRVRAQAESPDPSAVSWLLLDARPGGGAGEFGDITSIQRLYTSGGKAPAVGCDAQHVGRQIRVAYAAEYIFYHR